MSLPNLAKVATADLVDHIGTGKFSASYINWARTMQLLRENAPGWMPELVNAPDGYIVHQAPVGAYLLIRFRNGEQVTPPVPQAIMDNKNAAMPIDKITARDITDTHRRGVCMAAAFTFGLAYELWAKIPLESGYQAAEEADEMPEEVLVDWITYINDSATVGEFKTRSAEAEAAAASYPAALAKIRAAMATKVAKAKQQKEAA